MKEIACCIKESGTTEFIFFLALIQYSFSQWLRERKIIIAIPQANRPEEYFFSVIGRFVDLHMLQLELEAQKNFKSQLKWLAVKQNILSDAYSYNRCLASVNNLNQTKIIKPNVFFNYMNLPADLSLNGEEIQFIRKDFLSEFPEFPLTINIFKNPNQVKIEILCVQSATEYNVYDFIKILGDQCTLLTKGRAI